MTRYGTPLALISGFDYSPKRAHRKDVGLAVCPGDQCGHLLVRLSFTLLSVGLAAPRLGYICPRCGYTVTDEGQECRVSRAHKQRLLAHSVYCNEKMREEYLGAK